MSESRGEPAASRGRVAVVAVVAAVALAGVGGFAVGGSSAATAGGPADWSPYPGKEVTPDDDDDNDDDEKETDEKETETDTEEPDEEETETTEEASSDDLDCPPGYERVNDTDSDTDVDIEDNDEGYQLDVSYAGDWQGRVLTNETSTPIEGSGSEVINLDVEDDEDEHVGVSVTKTDLNNDTLSVELLYNGERVDSQERVRPTVRNFDLNEEDSNSDSSLDSTSDTNSLDDNEDDWATFGEDEESDAFGDDAFAQEDGDPFEEDSTDDTTVSEYNYQVRVVYDGDWSGSESVGGTSQSIDGNGTERIDINAQEGDVVSVYAGKDDDSDEELIVQLLRDDGVIAQASTEAEYGTATISTTLDGSQEVIEEVNDSDANDTNEVNESDVPEECEPIEDDDGEDTTTETTEADADLSIDTDEEAQIVFADQEVGESPPSVTVESATLPDSGFVVIHNASMLQGNEIEESIIGVSDELDAEQSEDIEVTLTEELEEDQELIAIAYRNTNENNDFEYDSGDADEPYTDDNGSAVADEAMVTVPGSSDEGVEDEESTTTDADAESAEVFTDTDTPTATATDTPDTAANVEEATPAPGTPGTAMSGNAAEESTETNAPGFGIGVAVVAVVGAALLATRRRG